MSFALISDTSYSDYMKLYDPPKQVVYEDIKLNDTSDEGGELTDRVSRMLEQIKPDDMLAYLVEQAHNLNASDIHIEPHEKRLVVRFRIDGVLFEAMNPPAAMQPARTVLGVSIMVVSLW